MTRTNRKNRLSPPLMHAFRSAHLERDAKKKVDLRDEAGERVLAGRRASVRLAITEHTLRREVERDLEALMNSIAMESSEDLSTFPAVRKSILNFGLPDVAHRSIEEIGVQDIPDEIKLALMHYEPRLVPETVRVKRDQRLDPDELNVRFLISADLLCEPLNVPVEFVAELEPESGKVAINKL